MTEAYESVAGTIPVSFSGTQPVSLSQASGTLIGQVMLRRDNFVSAQVSTATVAPGAGATVATVTPGWSALTEVTVRLDISGTTVGAADSSNVALNQNAAARLSPVSYVVGTAGTGSNPVYLPAPVLLSLAAVDTVNVTAIGAATGTATYIVTIVCRRIA